MIILTMGSFSFVWYLSFMHNRGLSIWRSSSKRSPCVFHTSLRHEQMCERGLSDNTIHIHKMKMCKRKKPSYYWNTFNFCVGLPFVVPSTERLAVILGTLLGTEVRAIRRAWLNIAQLINTTWALTELSTILRPMKKRKPLARFNSKQAIIH